MFNCDYYRWLRANIVSVLGLITCRCDCETVFLPELAGSQTSTSVIEDAIRSRKARVDVFAYMYLLLTETVGKPVC